MPLPLSIAADAMIKSIAYTSDRSAKAAVVKGEAALKTLTHESTLEIGASARKFLAVRSGRVAGAEFSATHAVITQALSAGDFQAALVGIRAARAITMTPGQALLLGQLAASAAGSAPKSMAGEFRLAGIAALRTPDMGKLDLHAAFRLATMRHQLGDESTGLTMAAIRRYYPEELRQIGQKATALRDPQAVDMVYAKLPAQGTNALLALSREFDAAYRQMGLRPRTRLNPEISDIRSRLAHAPTTAADAMTVARYFMSIGAPASADHTFRLAAFQAASSAEASAIANAAATLRQEKPAGLLNRAIAYVKRVWDRDRNGKIERESVIECYFRAMQKATTTPEKLAVVSAAEKWGLGAEMVDKEGKFVSPVLDRIL